MSLEERYRKIKEQVKKKEEEKTRKTIHLEQVEKDFKESQQNLKEKHNKEFKSVLDIRSEAVAQEEKLDELISKVEEKLQ